MGDWISLLVFAIASWCIVEGIRTGRVSLTPLVYGDRRESPVRFWTTMILAVFIAAVGAYRAIVGFPAQ